MEKKCLNSTLIGDPEFQTVDEFVSIRAYALMGRHVMFATFVIVIVKALTPVTRRIAS